MEIVNVILHGDVIDKLKELESESVQCVVTSPPYWGLRDYGTDGQLGLEATPEEYVENMVDVFREIKRVLKDDGTVWLNLGDSYVSQPAGNSDATFSTKQISNSGSHIRRSQSTITTNLKPKNLVGIPWRVAFALQDDGWYLRQDIIWHKPNPMPESVTDRCTKSHEYIFLLSKSSKYFYDADAIKTGYSEGTQSGSQFGGKKGNSEDGMKAKLQSSPQGFFKMADGVNKRSVWKIPIKPYKEAHFAVFPEKIPELCIKAGSKEGDVVLDPFFGSGTTGYVAQRLNRKWIGIELNKSFIEIAKSRFNQQELFYQ
jgi:DNA modification methylase